MLNIPTSPRVVLLIDADNVPSNQEYILKFSRIYGKLKKCRAYGDWKQQPLLASYNKVRKLNIECVQVDRIEKNATDKQLLNDADKILDEGDTDIFIIVSGDGHFSSLCRRIKDKGRKAVGISNEKQASRRLQKSCNSFYFIEQVKKYFI